MHRLIRDNDPKVDCGIAVPVAAEGMPDADHIVREFPDDFIDFLGEILQLLGLK